MATAYWEDGVKMNEKEFILLLMMTICLAVFSLRPQITNAGHVLSTPPVNTITCCTTNTHSHNYWFNKTLSTIRLSLN